ncbi:alpha/beta hydrolase [Glaciimonas immobilis]|uniref:Carboxylesterase n=1 Tax=Glaciimonas immobilis TaxID=728004 RepID=A0A840RNM8_9BURK|nr:alpha/beta fold hydrolase [Glaciimonas immobilis]MBB5198712.1 carboxylesterase [Glaciimonas immobilis]
MHSDQPIQHAVILLHGLCGSGLEMGSIPKALRKNGCAVIELLIPNYSAGHVDPDVTPHWEDWCAVVDSEITRLKANFKTVSICGLSMGATLALAVASRSTEAIAIVALSPVLRYDGWSIPWYQHLMQIPFFLGYKNWSHKEGEPYGIKNFDMRRRVANALKKDGVAAVGAAAIPARQLRGAHLMMAYVRKSLKKVKTNILVIHAIDDETASPKNPELILEKVSSEMRKVIWLGDCYHIITVDNEREIVTNETVQFLMKNIEMHLKDISYRELNNHSPLKDRRG